jgi:hypothetical protein
MLRAVCRDGAEMYRDADRGAGGRDWRHGRVGERSAWTGRAAVGPGRRAAARRGRYAGRLPLRVEVGRGPVRNCAVCRRGATVVTAGQGPHRPLPRRRGRRRTAGPGRRRIGRGSGSPARRETSFDALQRRLLTAPSKARKLVADVPASYVAFDVLAVAGVDLRMQRWTVRRGRLEKVASNWAAPLQLSPVTDSLDEAQEWFDVLPDAMGIEGLVVKGAATRYAGGQRGWVKVNSVGVVLFSVLGQGSNWACQRLGRSDLAVSDTCRPLRVRSSCEGRFRPVCRAGADGAGPVGGSSGASAGSHFTTRSSTGASRCRLCCARLMGRCRRIFSGPWIVAAVPRYA